MAKTALQSDGSWATDEKSGDLTDPLLLEDDMFRDLRSIPAALALGQLVGLLGWIDPLMIPLVLAGPLIVGGVAAVRGIGLAWVAALWASAGLCMTWTDWVVNREDVLFHLALTVIMPALASVGWGAVRLATRGRRTQQA